MRTIYNPILMKSILILSLLTAMVALIFKLK